MTDPAESSGLPVATATVDCSVSLATINGTLARVVTLLESAQPPADKHEEIDDFVAQARWIIATHSARSDSFRNRAGALLGFAGVLLGLILTALTSDNVPKGASTKVLACFTIVFLLVASILMLSVLWLVRLSLPGINEIRESWKSYVGGTLGGVRSRGIIANSLLGTQLSTYSATGVAQKVPPGGLKREFLRLKRVLRRFVGPTEGLDPLTAAKVAADAQGERLKLGVAMLFAAFLSTGAMIIGIAA